MNEVGWIKTYRSFRNSWMWSVKEPFDKKSAWLDMLMSAFYIDGEQSFKGVKISVKRGQFPTSVRILADRWMWSVAKVNRYIERLKAEQMINTERIDGGTLVTIVNYGFYQDERNSTDTQNGTVIETAPIHKTEQQRNGNEYNIETEAEHIKRNKEIRTEEIKEDKNTEKDITNVISKKKSYYPDDELLDEAFNEYVTMRKRIKKPICTDKALHRAMNTLGKLSGGDNDLAVKILNQSVDHCWQGLFELKEDNSNKQSNQNFNKGVIDWDNV